MYYFAYILLLMQIASFHTIVTKAETDYEEDVEEDEFEMHNEHVQEDDDVDENENQGAGKGEGEGEGSEIEFVDAEYTKVYEAYEEKIRRFTIFNKNNDVLLVKSVNFSEYWDAKVYNHMNWSHIPPIQPFKESIRYTFNLSHPDNSRVNQRWKITFEFKNQTFTNEEFVTTYMVPDDEEGVVSLSVDVLRGKFSVEPPRSPASWVELFNLNTRKGPPFIL